MGPSTQGNSGPCCCTCPPSSPCLTESYRAKTDLPCPYAALSHSCGLAVLPWSSIRGGKLEVNGCLTPDLIVPSKADGAAPNCQAILSVLKITSTSPAISSPPFSLSSISFGSSSSTWGLLPRLLSQQVLEASCIQAVCPINAVCNCPCPVVIQGREPAYLSGWGSRWSEGICGPHLNPLLFCS